MSTTADWVNEAIWDGNLDGVLILPTEVLEGINFELLLNEATKQGRIELCELAVEKGAREFNTALYHAAHSGHLEICEWLVEKGAREFDRALQHASDPAVRDFLKRAKNQYEEED